jgi:hypothetical protein
VYLDHVTRTNLTMSLKKANIGKKPTKESTPSVDIPTLPVDGAIVRVYNEAHKKFKEAEAQMASLEAELKRTGATAIFRANTVHMAPALKSVILKDATGSSIRVTLANQYPTLKEEAVTHLFEALGADVNDYVVQTVKASFDSKVFLDEDGDFRPEVYKAFDVACKKAALTVGVENPLSSSLINVLKPDFDERRYRDFTFASQAVIYETAPNKTSLSPL